MNGFFAGGFAQGLGSVANQARQTAMEAAHLNLQQKQQEWMQQRFDRQAAIDPLKHILSPYTAGSVLPAIPKALDYAKDPDAFSYTPEAKVSSASVPTMVGDDNDTSGAMDSSDLRIGGGGDPVSQAPITGGAGYNSMLADVGAHAQEDTWAHEVAKMKALLSSQIFKKDYDTNIWQQKEDYRNQQKPGTAAAVASAVAPVKTQQAVDTQKALAPGRVQQAADTAAATAKATGRITDNGLKPLDRAIRDSAFSAMEQRDKNAAIIQMLEQGRFPTPGKGTMGLNDTAETVGGWFGQTWNDPRVTAAAKLLEGMRLEQEKALGGVRLASSPQMADRLRQIWASKDNSPGGVLARLKQSQALLEQAIADDTAKARSSNMDPSEILGRQPHAFSEEDLLGAPAGGRSGIFQIPGMPNPFKKTVLPKGTPAPQQPSPLMQPRQPVDIQPEWFNPDTGQWGR